MHKMRAPPPSLIERYSSEEEARWSRALAPRSIEESHAAAIAGPVVSLSSIVRLCRMGATEKVRATYWKLLIGFLPCNTATWEEVRAAKAREYREIVRLVCSLDDDGNVVLGKKSYRTVDMDVPRTMPALHFFNNADPSCSENGLPAVFPPTQQSLRRILHTLAGVNSGLGYVQGMNELAGHLLYAFSGGRREAVDETVESEVFFFFQTILGYLGDDFCRSLDFDQDTGISSTIRHFQRLFQFLDAELWEHLQVRQIKPEFYAFRWITLLFTQEFNVPDVFRIWDYLFSYREELRAVLLYTAVAMLHHQRDVLLRMSHLCEMLPLLQSYPPCDVGDLLKKAQEWVNAYDFRLVHHLKICSEEDVVQLRRLYKMPVAGDTAWKERLGVSWRGWMSSIKDLVKHVKGSE